MKPNREKIFNKFSGHCAYCGCELEKGWHVDEIKPVGRIYSYDEFNRNRKRWTGKYEHPENLNFENQVPSCPSCNINKHGMSIEHFRQVIEHFIISLNRDFTQYKIAKRYGLIKETGNKVKFYFEDGENEHPHP